MAGELHPPIRLHQCLFGYDDGHRLLASSSRLPTDVNSTLLVMSDLAPNLTTMDVEGYWTGVPLTSAKYYALMRTWPALEMPRPGCVWTHALLVGFSDIGRFVDLRTLTGFIARPRATAHFDAYTLPLAVESALARAVNRHVHRSIGAAESLEVLRALYGPESNPILMLPPGPWDDMIFAVWSQQWPRLRRAFAFRTAGAAFEGGSAEASSFNTRVFLGLKDAGSAMRSSASSNPELWEEAAIRDLRSIQPTEFRRFLWR